MASNLEFHRARERLIVGRRFLMLRPFLAAIGALLNSTCLALSPAPSGQKRVLLAALLGTLCAFLGEALWLRRRALSERWLRSSLALTLCALAGACALSGGLLSPLLPLLFAPVVVGFAAFGRSKESALVLAVTLSALFALSAQAPLDGFPPPAPPWSFRMLLISSALSFALSFVGVVSLVDAHARVAAELERMRTDVLREAEQRAVSLEKVGALVAHEVKNPLTAVRGLVQLVQRKLTDERDRERLSVVIDQVDRALSVLHDYLGFARPLDDLTLAEVDLRALLDEVAAVVEARALAHAVKVHTEGARVTLALDRGRMRDALLNLALNALGAMPSGGELWLRVSEQPGCVRLEVQDTGVGMSEAQLAKLGTAFASASQDGTGLGVLLARAVAEQHGGKLSYESAKGRGTCAKLELPGRGAPP